MDANDQPVRESNRRYYSLIAWGMMASFLLVFAKLMIDRGQAMFVPQQASTLIPVAILSATLFFLIRSVGAFSRGGDVAIGQTRRWLRAANLLTAVALALLASNIITAFVPILVSLIGECAAWFLEEGTDSSASATSLGTLQISDDRDWVDEEQSGFEPNCTQVISRFQTDQGEMLSGQARASFRSGEKTQALHIGFCPPFAEDPTAEIFQTDGPSVSLKPTSVERFGMRFEIKRTDPATDDEVIVEFMVAGNRKSA